MDSSDGEGSRLNSGGYFCPQCCSKYCELPVECKACGLTLVSAPHLARSYHHLFPVENFKELECKDMKDMTELCFACQKRFGEHDKHVSMFTEESWLFHLRDYGAENFYCVKMCENP